VQARTLGCVLERHFLLDMMHSLNLALLEHGFVCLHGRLLNYAGMSAAVPSNLSVWPIAVLFVIFEIVA
jgi:hypothetical protein